MNFKILFSIYIRNKNLKISIQIYALRILFEFPMIH